MFLLILRSICSRTTKKSDNYILYIGYCTRVICSYNHSNNAAGQTKNAEIRFESIPDHFTVIQLHMFQELGIKDTLWKYISFNFDRMGCSMVWCVFILSQSLISKPCRWQSFCLTRWEGNCHSQDNTTHIYFVPFPFRNSRTDSKTYLKLI